MWVWTGRPCYNCNPCWSWWSQAFLGFRRDLEPLWAGANSTSILVQSIWFYWQHLLYATHKGSIYFQCSTALQLQIRSDVQFTVQFRVNVDAVTCRACASKVKILHSTSDGRQNFMTDEDKTNKSTTTWTAKADLVSVWLQGQRLQDNSNSSESNDNGRFSEQSNKLLQWDHVKCPLWLMLLFFICRIWLPDVRKEWQSGTVRGDSCSYTKIGKIFRQMCEDWMQLLWSAWFDREKETWK